MLVFSKIIFVIKAKLSSIQLIYFTVQAKSDRASFKDRDHVIFRSDEKQIRIDFAYFVITYTLNNDPNR